MEYTAQGYIVTVAVGLLPRDKAGEYDTWREADILSAVRSCNVAELCGIVQLPENEVVRAMLRGKDKVDYSIGLLLESEFKKNLSAALRYAADYDKD